MLSSILSEILSLNINNQTKPWSKRDIGKKREETYTKQQIRDVLNLISGNETGKFTLLILILLKVYLFECILKCSLKYCS